MRAARLLEKGYSQSEVARRVGAHRQSVSQWAAELQEKGRAGLKRAGRAGRKPRLDALAIRKIEQGLKRGPEALGYATSLWTSARVAHLIETAWGPLSSGPCLAHFAAVRMELPASGRPRPGAERREDPAMEAEALAGD
jgi:transposase-like protein